MRHSLDKTPSSHAQRDDPQDDGGSAKICLHFIPFKSQFATALQGENRRTG
jgi:hypothetical protein